MHINAGCRRDVGWASAHQPLPAASGWSFCAKPPRPPESPLPVRKHPVHGVLESTSGPTIVFDTVCTKDRQPTLATPAVHNLLRDVWLLSDAWRVGRYVILPDHIHYFAAAADPSIDFDAWVCYWKSTFTRAWRERYGGSSPVVWQTDHWDTTLRTWQAYDEKWEYVRNNPTRHGLITDPAAWPCQGELHPLTWD